MAWPGIWPLPASDIEPWRRAISSTHSRRPSRRCAMHRPTWAEVDLGAVAENTRALHARLMAGGQLMAVVKADGYGHGAIAVARAALGAGATWLGVAIAEEGLALRAAGIAA